MGCAQPISPAYPSIVAENTGDLKGIGGPAAPGRAGGARRSGSGEAGAPAANGCGAPSYQIGWTPGQTSPPRGWTPAQRPISVHESVNTVPRELPRDRPPGSPSGGASSSARPTISRTSPRSFPRRNWRAPRASAPTALRQRWMAGRGALRTVLGRTLGIDAADVAIRAGRARSSRARRRTRRASTSTSRIRAASRWWRSPAISRAPARVGVDIEHRDREVGADRLARKFLTPRGAGDACGPPTGPRRQRFLRYWTCKEAMSKATGDGLIAPFRQLDVDLAHPPRLRAGPPPYLPGDWSLALCRRPGRMARDGRDLASGAVNRRSPRARRAARCARATASRARRRPSGSG